MRREFSGSGQTAPAMPRSDRDSCGNNGQPTSRAPIFNEPEYGGDRSHGLTWASHPAAKIAIFGLPRSGNNWVKALLCDYFSKPGINLFTQQSSQGIGITHYPFSPQIEVRSDFIHGVVLVRDLRDVITSFYFATQTERFRMNRPYFQYNDPEAFYFDWFLPIVVRQFSVHTFSDDYARWYVPVVRYERLLEDPLGEMRKLVLRWGMEWDEQRMEDAANKNSFSRLKEGGKQFEVHIDPSHFRRGVRGAYKEDLPAKIVKDINDRFSDVQRRWGYD